MKKIQTRFRRFIILRNNLRNQLELKLFVGLQKEFDKPIGGMLLVELKSPLRDLLRGR